MVPTWSSLEPKPFGLGCCYRRRYSRPAALVLNLMGKSPKANDGGMLCLKERCPHLLPA
jgi:hypothetical protein